MLLSGTLALKIEYLVPDLLSNCQQKNPEKLARPLNGTSPVVSNAIQSLFVSNDDIPKEHTRVYLEEESQTRVKNLLDKAKSGSFLTEDQHTVSTIAQKKMTKFENLTKELFDTEKRYLETLRIMKDISDKIETIESDQREVLRDVFKEIPSLYMLHAYMDNKFYQGSSQDLTLQSWIQIFTSAELAPYFNIYKAFLSRVQSTYKTLQLIYDKDRAFNEFCQTVVMTSQFTEQHIQNIPGMYIGIQSRLTRYLMLLQKIADLFHNGLDRERCECALKNIKSILKTSEEEVTKNEMINHALMINEKLEGRKNHLDKLALFIRSGPCLKIPRRSVGKKPLSRHLFLFSDFLVITEPEFTTTGRYLVKSELTVVSMMLEEPKPEDDIPMHTCIRVRAVECVVELMFADENEKLSWWKSLEDTIEQERRKNDIVQSFVPQRLSALDSNGGTSRAAEWVKDEQATMCALCYRRFTHIRRRHHCRACGKIFCRHCSSYSAKIDHLGPSEVRVCEVDFYRLNPNLKPKNAAALERLARFSEAGQRYAPYHHSFLMWTTQVRGQWPRKKSHLRVEYSAGLVHREGNSSRQYGHHLLHLRNLSPASSSLTGASSSSPPSSSSSSPFVATPPRQLTFDFAPIEKASDASATTVPLPAARLIFTPSMSRVFCVLQPDTLLAIFAAKEDAKPYSQVALLGTRLIYLVRLGVEKGDVDHSDSSTPSSRSLSRASSSSSLNLPTPTPSARPSSPTEPPLSSRTIRPPLQKALTEGDAATHQNNHFGQKTTHASLLAPSERPTQKAEVEGEENGDGGGSGETPSICWPKYFKPVSDEALSVLSNMNGFLVLPSNTDKMGHYFEAPNEELRNMWIKKIKSCIVEFGRG
uniref:FYVE-type domain-containing protein n=3 Tax=Mesocestoides corti TaxID=53468 RepID=A0A5K3EJX6_MESCO